MPEAARLQHADVDVYVYAWGNNARRAELKGRRCVVEARGRMDTVLVRFLDSGERVTTSRLALRRIAAVRAHVEVHVLDRRRRPRGARGRVRGAVEVLRRRHRRPVGEGRGGSRRDAGLPASRSTARARSPSSAGASPRMRSRGSSPTTTSARRASSSGHRRGRLRRPHRRRVPRRGPGHRTGRYAVQGNILASEDVVAAMEAAFVDSAGMPLGHRLVAALEAGQEEGGDARAAVRGGRGRTGRRSAGAARGHRPRGRPARRRPSPSRSASSGAYEIHRRWDALRARRRTTGRALHELGAAILREALDGLGEDAFVLSTSRASRRSPGRARRRPPTSSVPSCSTRACDIGRARPRPRLAAGVIAREDVLAPLRASTASRTGRRLHLAHARRLAGGRVFLKAEKPAAQRRVQVPRRLQRDRLAAAEQRARGVAGVLVRQPRPGRRPRRLARGTPAVIVMPEDAPRRSSPRRGLRRRGRRSTTATPRTARPSGGARRERRLP